MWALPALMALALLPTMKNTLSGVCGNEMFTVFMCRKCEHILYVKEDENFPQKLGKIAAKACSCCGEQEEGLWRLLGRVEGFEETVFTEESDED